MKPLRVDIITIFPDYFRAPFDYGIIRRARAAGLVTIEAHDLRTWTSDKHHVVDDRPFGGRSEEHTSELQSRQYLVCRLLLEKKKRAHKKKAECKQTTPIRSLTLHVLQIC